MSPKLNARGSMRIYRLVLRSISLMAAPMAVSVQAWPSRENRDKPRSSKCRVALWIHTDEAEATVEASRQDSKTEKARENSYSYNQVAPITML